MRPKEFIIKIDSPLEPRAAKGTKVYDFLGYDYGLARDDYWATGVEHVSVTLKTDGSAPSFTVAIRDLDPA